MRWYPSLSFLWSRKFSVLLTAAAFMVLAVAANLFLPRLYRASSILVINFKGADALSGAVLPIQLLPGYLATQIDIVRSPTVALRAAQQLGLQDDPETVHRHAADSQAGANILEWAAGQIMKKTTVVPSRESSVLEISYSDIDPARAAKIANALASAYQQINLDLKSNPARQASHYLDSQMVQLKDKLVQAQARYTGWMKEKGLAGDDNRLDLEGERLAGMSAQLTTVRSQLAASQAMGREAGGASGSDSPTVMADPVVQNLKTTLAQAEARLERTKGDLLPAHPRFQAAKEEVDKLRIELRKATRASIGSVASNTRTLQQRESELQAGVAAQKQKLLGLRSDRDRLALLSRDVENAQRAFDAAAQRASQTSVEGNSSQSDISILTPAGVPERPAGARPGLVLAVAMFCGLLAGIAVATVRELLDRRIRSAWDLENALPPSALGNVQLPALPGTPAPPIFSRLRLSHN